jgi:anti-anti-sigma factor
MASGPDVYDDGVLQVRWLGNPPVVVIAGEIDESNYSGLVTALDRLANAAGEIHVNLAGVAFCDLAGMRAIIRLAEGTGSGGGGTRRLVLHEVPRQMLKVLQIVGWDTAPGVVMDQGS